MESLLMFGDFPIFIRAEVIILLLLIILILIDLILNLKFLLFL
jgi:hypothetical protein